MFGTTFEYRVRPPGVIDADASSEI
jgi:hypothetical protein